MPELSYGGLEHRFRLASVEKRTGMCRSIFPVQSPESKVLVSIFWAENPLVFPEAFERQDADKRSFTCFVEVKSG